MLGVFIFYSKPPSNIEYFCHIYTKGLQYMPWSQFDEYIYQKMVEDYNSKGDRTIKFNGVEGDLSTLIEAVELVRSMAGYKGK